ncbi:hypothetical protein H6F67_12540 [Microcoleus sp. FACHB-1515]|uniref:hypothetical protein n=1 Tax=Cyanophyceae TaxID=3028117 RepID=UPI001689C9F0|nr:hypothetical protein [Microcoleus sp. FACHB-1515]MBD2090682.1 hypothetical protein [Microcoleus sp. FACHB-1515]
MMYFDSDHIQQLRQLHQQLAAQNDVIESMLELSKTRLGTLLTEDARSLLATPKFARFVRLMLAEMAANSGGVPLPVQISADPCAWLLLSLPLPLRLWRLPADTTDTIGVRAELGKWQQVLNVPTAEALVSNESAMQSWEAIAAQIEQSMPQLPIAPALQPFLAEELMCILCYLGECEDSEADRSVVEQS